MSDDWLDSDNPFNGSTMDGAERESETVEQEEDDFPSEETQDGGNDAEPDYTPAEIHYDSLYEGTDSTVEKWIQNGEYKHVPVYGYAIAHIHTRKYDPKDEQDHESKVNGKTFSWWEDRSLIPKHPYVLINPVILANHTIKFEQETGVPTREMLNLSKENQFTVVDSGGFQVVSQDKIDVVDSYDEHDFTQYDIYPPTLLDWQVENGDAGTILDIPPYFSYKDSGNKDFDDDMTETEWRNGAFREGLDRTKENTTQMWNRLQELRDEGNERAQDYRFMGVIQGQPAVRDNPPWKFLSDWHEEMEPLADYDGWAMSPTPSKHMGQLALHLAYADEFVDTDYLHVLAAGSYQARALLTYASILQDRFITSDSSGYARGSMFRSVILPNTWNRDIIITQQEEGSQSDVESPELDRFPCRIEPFITIGEEYGIDYLTEDADSCRSTSMALHNLNREFDATAMIDSFLHSYGREVTDVFKVKNKRPKRRGNTFWKVMGDLLSDKNLVQLYYAMDFLRIANEDGIEAAFSKDGGGYSIPGKFGGDESWTIRKGGGSALEF